MAIKRRQVVQCVTSLGAILALPTAVSTGRASTDDIQRAGTVLVDPATDISEWKSDGTRPRPVWTNETVAGVDAISVTARGSVGILHRSISVDVTSQPVLTWRWYASALPQEADLSSTDADDVGAGLALVFGEVGLFKKHPPMLIYIWGASKDQSGDVVQCVRHPETMRFIVVENAQTPLGQWRDATRNVVDDYASAFGQPPTERVRSVALWADSDQTGGETVAAFGPARLQRS